MHGAEAYDIQDQKGELVKHYHTIFDSEKEFDVALTILLRPSQEMPTNINGEARPAFQRVAVDRAVTGDRK